MSDADRDIKIFKPNGKSDEDDLRFIEELNHQRANGNLVLAKKLGKALADALVLKTGDGDQSLFTVPGEPDEDTLYRVRELAVFAVERSLQTVLKNQLLCATAVNAFYDLLIKLMPDFYEKVSSGTAFTFYCLDVKESVNISEHIGASFAMLCGRESSEKLSTLGTEVYDTACRESEAVIYEYRFAK